MFSVVATKTTCCVKMTDVIRIGFPVDLHLREKIAAVNILGMDDGFADGC